MKKLPESEVYEASLRYWPYKESINRASLYLTGGAVPLHARVLDIMCGPGHLLGEIAKRRSDLLLTGVDIDKRYVRHGRETCPTATFFQGDVRSWQVREPFDVVICTGALHHVRYEEQEAAIANIAALVKPGGFAFIADCYIDDWPDGDETKRRLAAAKLGYEYLAETIRNGAPDDVIAWTMDILHNDVLGHECKTSVAKRGPLFAKYFKKVSIEVQAWPYPHTGYGDWIHICTK